MIFKKKIARAKKQDLNILELVIIEVLINSFPDMEGKEKIRRQIKYLPKIKRLKYKTSIATEFYPESIDSIPNEILFNRKEDFRLARIEFIIDSKSFVCSVYAVLGSLFEIKLRPCPPQLKDQNGIRLKEVKIEENID